MVSGSSQNLVFTVRILNWVKFESSAQYFYKPGACTYFARSGGIRLDLDKLSLVLHYLIRRFLVLLAICIEPCLMFRMLSYMCAHRSINRAVEK